MNRLTTAMGLIVNNESKKSLFDNTGLMMSDAAVFKALFLFLMSMISKLLFQIF